jgi:hypothetical protein
MTPTHTIHLPESLATLAVSKRDICGKYTTTESGYLVVTHAQYIGFYCMLKSLSKSGIIRNFNQQITHLQSITNLAPSTIYKYINECIKLDLLSNEKGNIKLAKWSAVCALFDLPCQRFVQVTYQTNNTLHKPKYILHMAEQAANMQAQSYMALKKFFQSYYPETSEAYIQKLKELAINKPTQLIGAAIGKRNAWVSKFINGVEKCEPESEFDNTDNVPVAYFLQENRHIFRGTRGMLKAFGLNPNNEVNPKRKRTITYYKHQLEKRGLASIKRNNITYTNCVGYRPAKEVQSNSATAQKVGLKSVFVNNKVGVWMPDVIIPTDLFKKANQNQTINQTANAA